MNDFHDDTKRVPDDEAAPDANADEKRAARMENAAKELQDAEARLKTACEKLAKWEKQIGNMTGRSDSERAQIREQRANAKKEHDAAQIDRNQKADKWRVLFDGDHNALIVRPTLASALDDIVRELQRFFVQEDDDANIFALWAVQTHTFMLEHFEHTPFLMVWSKEPGCGKTYLAEFAEQVCANPRSTSSATGTRLELFLMRVAAKRNDPMLRKIWDDNAYDKERAKHRPPLTDAQKARRKQRATDRRPRRASNERPSVKPMPTPSECAVGRPRRRRQSPHLNPSA